ncbi:MAG: hypothetical protein A2161_02580 [Candidatus Schekmanbacteria bacterium RBG_13_48_7]|uniref:protein acetyllysine N-acetyltransferase n=1 Tax=Candidatus Schekmanbacteria bacterium RBG_13_48_7 TaxID=1817878 RepID=A0A1F7S323_9BACT|nr:MAG: hypothetical protein A2161_02580 [Candidatus Schekmanbacteria bacterium RBG_13_48_7]
MEPITIELIADSIKKYRNVVVLTGAGISAESGIPPFRGAGGLWVKFNPEEYATIQIFLRNPSKAWELFKVLGDTVGQAKPNAAHYALAEMEQKNYLSAIITQNVDGLHQKAGNKNVIEFHGTNSEYSCLKCNNIYPADKISLEKVPVYCKCGFPLKPNVVLFGEMIPHEALMEAKFQAENCKVMLVIGTSAQVYPASHMPAIAKSNGAIVYEINPEETPLTGYISNSILLGNAGEILPQLVNLLS